MESSSVPPHHSAPQASSAVALLSRPELPSPPSLASTSTLRSCPPAANSRYSDLHLRRPTHYHHLNHARVYIRAPPLLAYPRVLVVVIRRLNSRNGFRARLSRSRLRALPGARDRPSVLPLRLARRARAQLPLQVVAHRTCIIVLFVALLCECHLLVLPCVPPPTLRAPRHSRARSPNPLRPLAIPSTRSRCPRVLVHLDPVC